MTTSNICILLMRVHDKSVTYGRDKQDLVQPQKLIHLCCHLVQFYLQTLTQSLAEKMVSKLFNYPMSSLHILLHITLQKYLRIDGFIRHIHTNITSTCRITILCLVAQVLYCVLVLITDVNMSCL